MSQPDNRNEVTLKIKTYQGFGPKDKIIESEITLKSADKVEVLIQKSLEIKEKLEKI